jgi:hypothetical protein
VIVSITAIDIAAGRPKSINACPIALALQRATGVPNAWIGMFHVSVTGGDDGIQDTPLVARDFIRRIDAGQPVEPFTFELA